MQKHFKYIITWSLFLFLSAVIQAQQSVHSAGSTEKNATGEVSFSIGQVFYTPSSDKNHVSQGVQQTYIIEELSVEDLQNIDIDVTVFPNPVMENLSIKLKASANENTFYVLTDLNGKLLDQNRLQEGIQNITMTRFAQAVYLLTIYRDHSPVRSYKIIKN